MTQPILGGVFETLRTRLSFQGGHRFLEVVTCINDFRNTYVAHQEQELTDKNPAEQELKVWIEALHTILNQTEYSTGYYSLTLQQLV